MKLAAQAFAVFSALALSACELYVGDQPRTPIEEPQTYSMDGVKYIAPSVADGAAPMTYNQPTYAISDSGRLLLRFESLSNKLDQISLADGRRVSLEIGLPAGSDASAAISSIEVCPILKNWMMLATWDRAHPMPGGAWSRDGGDYDPEGCVRGALSAKTGAAARSTNEPQVIQFDVTQWFVDYVKGRAQNYGLILLSGNGGEVTVIGDADGTYSPRINWLYVH
jgi:hypothetical protein